MSLIPNDLGSWIFLIIACVLGFFIGQWMHHRRKKGEAEHDALTRMVSNPKKRLSKKERRKGSRLSK